jgi:hypothetical protein
MTNDLMAAVAAAMLFIGPFIVLAVAASAFGVDSRPGFDEPGPDRWMAGG